MAEDKAKILEERTKGFVSIAKRMEKWAAKLPAPEAITRFLDENNVLLMEQAMVYLEEILETIRSTQTLELFGEPMGSSLMIEPPIKPSSNPFLKVTLPPQEVVNKAESPATSAKVPSTDTAQSFASSSSSATAPQQKATNIFLPEYSGNIPKPNTAVPIFYGDPRFWPTFKESFERVIHEHLDLTLSEKVQYLVGYLSGEAQSLISEIPPSEENYGVIWLTMKLVYGDSTQMDVRYDFTPRFHNPSSSIEMYYYLQEVMDYCFIVHNTLSFMSCKAFSEEILYKIVRSKLEYDMLSQLIDNLNGKKPTFEQISGFLQYQIQKMYNLSKNRREFQMKEGRWEGLIGTTSPFQFCTYCRVQTHKLYNCEGFLKLKPTERYAHALVNNKCFNCLGDHHTYTSCMSQNVCAYCKDRHHTLLHEEEDRTDELSKLEFHFLKGKEDTYKIPLHLFSPKSVILGTVALKGCKKGGKQHTSVRALLDSGSQCNLISEKMRKKLKLPLLPLVSSLYGIGDAKRGVLGLTFLQISPHFNVKHKITLIAYVIDKICFDLPSIKVAPRVKASLKKFKLADPNFDIPSPIDVLIGSEMFPTLLKKEQYRVPDSHVYGIETFLGWVMMGRGPTDEPVDPKLRALCSVNAVKHTLGRLNDIDEFFHPEKFSDVMDQLNNLVKKLSVDDETKETNRDENEKPQGSMTEDLIKQLGIIASELSDDEETNGNGPDEDEETKKSEN